MDQVQGPKRGWEELRMAPCKEPAKKWGPQLYNFLELNSAITEWARKWISLKLLEKNTILPNLNFSPKRSTLDFWPPELKITKLCCFKPLRFWPCVTAATGKNKEELQIRRKEQVFCFINPSGYAHMELSGKSVVTPAFPTRNPRRYKSLVSGTMSCSHCQMEHSTWHTSRCSISNYWRNVDSPLFQKKFLTPCPPVVHWYISLLSFATSLLQIAVYTHCPQFLFPCPLFGGLQ